VSFGGYSPGQGRAIDVQQLGDHCVIDHNAYTVVGQPFEGKIRSSTFTTLPGRDFEAHGRVIEVSAPFPEDPARSCDPPDLTSLRQDGAYAGESALPVFGPR